MEQVQANRRAGRLKDRIATLVVAVGLSLGGAVLLEALLLITGQLIGQPALHSVWLDGQVGKALAWIASLPVIGSLVSASASAVLPGAGVSRDVCVLAALIFSPALIPATHIGPVLAARYDDEAIRPPLSTSLGLRWAGPLGDAQQRVWEEVLLWCRAGTGSGRSPLFRPWALPDVPQRFSVAVLTGPNGVGKTHLAEAIASHLDGATRLAASPGAGWRWLIRLQAKWDDVRWWRARRESGTWDVGCLVEDPAARLRLGQFRPRRPTLILADELMSASLRQSIGELAGHRTEFRHPVRLLVIDTTLPDALSLCWDEAAGRWETAAYDLGHVRVIKLSNVNFQVAQFRAMVGAQLVSDTTSAATDSPHMHVMGSDANWQTVVRAFDHEPIQMAECIHLARAAWNGQLDKLLADSAEALAQLERQQRERRPVMSPADLLGVRREVLRERVIGRRATQREAAIRQSFGSGADADLAWHALMIASLANGAPLERINLHLGARFNVLTPQRLQGVFGSDLPQGWVPPLGPKVVLDELLRRHFETRVGTDVNSEQSAQAVRAMADAWLCNPAGAMRTVMRWSRRAHADPLAAAMRELPDLDALARREEATDANVSRGEIARAFLELAVLNNLDWQTADEALRRLDDREWGIWESSIDGVFSNPDAYGAPAILLWLRTVDRRWTASPIDSHAHLLRLVRRARLLLVQDVIVASSQRASLAFPIREALAAILPRVGALVTQSVSAEVASAIADLGRDSERFPILGESLRKFVLERLFESMTTDPRPVSGQPDQWLRTVGSWLCSEPSADKTASSLEHWKVAREGAGAKWLAPNANAVDTAWGDARCLGVMAGHASLANPERCPDVIELLMQLAHSWEVHEGIEVERARGYKCLAFVASDIHAEATGAAAFEVLSVSEKWTDRVDTQEHAAIALRHFVQATVKFGDTPMDETVAALAALGIRWPAHSGIQLQCATALCSMAYFHRNRNAEQTERAASEVGRIAQQCPNDPDIHCQAIKAFCALVEAYLPTESRRMQDAVRKVELLAQRWPTCDQVQYERAVALRTLADRHRDQDISVTETAADGIGTVAATWHWHHGIQRECANAYGFVAWAYRNRDAEKTERAAQLVAELGKSWPADPVIQLEVAVSFRLVAWANHTRDPIATSAAVREVAALAKRWPNSDRIQYEASQAFRLLAWAYKDRDPERTQAANNEVRMIAARWPSHAGMQGECVTALRHLAWARKGGARPGIEEAVKEAVQIAEKWPENVGMQVDCAIAYRHWCSAESSRDPQHAQRAAVAIGTIADRFTGNRLIVGELAHSWRLVLESAVRFDDAERVERALSVLDRLVGYGQYQGQVPSSVYEHRQFAHATANVWRRARKARGCEP